MHWLTNVLILALNAIVSLLASEHTYQTKGDNSATLYQQRESFTPQNESMKASYEKKSSNIELPNFSYGDLMQQDLVLDTRENGVHEKDGESTKKIIGSSVVTSVSVILNGDEEKYTDAVGHQVSKPQPSEAVASPIDFLNPDRYEFYTFDDNGELVKRLMTMQEIQSIVANENGEGQLTISSAPFLESDPEKNVQNIVSNVKNVLNKQVENSKNMSAGNVLPVLDTPDVTSSWSMILPAIFSNSGGDIFQLKKPQQVVMTPESELLESPPKVTTKETTKKPKPNKRKPGQKRKPSNPTSTATTPQIVQEELEPHESVYTGIQQYMTSNDHEFDAFSQMQMEPIYFKPTEFTTQRTPPKKAVTTSKTSNNSNKTTNRPTSPSRRKTSNRPRPNIGGIKQKKVPTKTPDVTKPQETKTPQLETLQTTKVKDSVKQNIKNNKPTIIDPPSEYTEKEVVLKPPRKRPTLQKKKPTTPTSQITMTSPAEISPISKIPIIEEVQNTTAAHISPGYPIPSSAVDKEELLEYMPSSKLPSTQNQFHGSENEEQSQTEDELKVSFGQIVQSLTPDPNRQGTIGAKDTAFKPLGYNSAESLEKLEGMSNRRKIPTTLTSNVTEINMKHPNVSQSALMSSEMFNKPIQKGDNIEGHLPSETNVDQGVNILIDMEMANSSDVATPLPLKTETEIDNKNEESTTDSENFSTTNVSEFDEHIMETTISPVERLPITIADLLGTLLENENQDSTTIMPPEIDEFNIVPQFNSSEVELMVPESTPDLLTMATTLAPATYTIETVTNETKNEIQTQHIGHQNADDNHRLFNVGHFNTSFLFKPSIDSSNLNRTNDSNLSQIMENLIHESLKETKTQSEEESYTTQFPTFMETENYNNSLLDFEHLSSVGTTIFTTILEEVSVTSSPEKEESNDDSLASKIRKADLQDSTYVIKNMSDENIEQTTAAKQYEVTEQTTINYATEKFQDSTENMFNPTSDFLEDNSIDLTASSENDDQTTTTEIYQTTEQTISESILPLLKNETQLEQEHKTEMSYAKFEPTTWKLYDYKENLDTTTMSSEESEESLTSSSIVEDPYIKLGETLTDPQNLHNDQTIFKAVDKPLPGNAFPLSNIISDNKLPIELVASNVTSLLENKVTGSDESQQIAIHNLNNDGKTKFNNLTVPPMSTTSFGITETPPLPITTSAPKITSIKRYQTLKPVSYYKQPLFAALSPPEYQKPYVNSQQRPMQRPAALTNLKASFIQTTRSPVKLDPNPSHSMGLEESVLTLDPDLLNFTRLCNELAFSYWKSITAEKVSSARSLVISPFALTSILSMVFLGARGSTSGEMNEILKLDDMVTFNPHLIFKNITDSVEAATDSDIATSAFVREIFSDRSKGKLLPFFKEKTHQFYAGHAEEVNFNVVNDVIRRRTNLLVKRHTMGKVQEYLRTNNVWINGPLATISANLFQTDCTSGSTTDRDGELFFQVHPTVKQRRLVPIPAVLYKTGFTAGYDVKLDATVVAFGDIHKTVSTIYVMPGHQSSANQADNLDRLEKQLVENAFSENAWSNLLTTLMDRPGLAVQLPRFSHRSFVNSSLGLQKMGLKSLFSSDFADLRGLTTSSNRDIYLSDMIQINTFSTCGEERIADQHHIEMYPAPQVRKRNKDVGADDLSDSSESIIDFGSLVHDSAMARSFYDDLLDPKYLELPLPLRPRQARVPDAPPRLRFDKPFMYFVRHNPTGIILFMGRFNPRLLP